MQTPYRLLATATIALMAMAGCVGIETDTQTNALEVTSDKAQAGAGEPVLFQAEAAEASPGAAFLFDFGDGETARVEADQQAQAEHAFAAGGHYEVAVSLVSGNETISSATQVVHIVETTTHAAQVIASGPLSNETSRASWMIEADANATLLDVDLSLENSALIGQSVVIVTVVDGNGTELANETVTIDEGGAETLSLDIALDGETALVLEAFAEAGSASVGGASELRYD